MSNAQYQQILRTRAKFTFSAVNESNGVLWCGFLGGNFLPHVNPHKIHPPKLIKTTLTSKEDLPMDTAPQEEKRKTATIMEEPSEGLHEKQKHGR